MIFFFFQNHDFSVLCKKGLSSLPHQVNKCSKLAYNKPFKGKPFEKSNSCNFLWSDMFLFMWNYQGKYN